ncbi:right-handed parallel beta-helix repeat-containing protein [uncultured Methanobacterium sp.]|uniref:right-handed parallel beta-helix repeat-containing protein n=1 Tax=uncultured Methanobacterium sp. TaxID=176306 RepID=UPI00374A599E
MLLFIATLVSAGAVLCEPVAAATVDVNSSMSNSEIQAVIDNCSAGDTVNFLEGVYNNIALTISNVAVNLAGLGAILNSNIDSTVFSISGSNASGTNISGFTINGKEDIYGSYGINATKTSNINIVNNIFNNTVRAIYFNNVNQSSIKSNGIYNSSELNPNYGVYIVDTGTLSSKNNVQIDSNILINSTGGIHVEGSGFNITNNLVDGNYGYLNGVDGQYVFNTLIENNTIRNIDDGININHQYQNLTIVGNIISNMTNASHGNHDGISLVDRSLTAPTIPTIIANNTINNTYYGIFLGSNFLGTISGNTINNSRITGMNITEKGAGPSETYPLNANITGNNIINATLGISMENHNVQYLHIDNNNISIGNGGSYSIQYNKYFLNNGNFTVGDGNNFNKPEYFTITTAMNNSYIQSLLDAAKAGDIFSFMAGTYSNIALSITKSVNLVGNGATLNGAGNDSILTVMGDGASGTSISGFTIANGTGHYGVCLNSANNVTVANNTITGNMVGVDLFNSVNNTISGNKVTGNSWSGICLDTSNGNTLTNNNVSSNQEGVFMANSAQNTIGSNVVSGNAYSGISDISGTHNTIQGNTIQSNVWNGMLIQRSTDDMVSGNTVQNTSWSGITLDQATSSTITGNSINGNQEGIFGANNLAGNTISYNDISSNSGNGVNVIQGNNNTVSVNSIQNNGMISVFVQTSNATTITSNTLNNTGWCGVCLDRATNTGVTRNNIENNYEQGLAVGGSNNTFNSNYWSDWNTTYPRPIDGDNNIYDNNPQLTPY